MDVVSKCIVNYLMNGDTYIDFVAVGNQGCDFTSHSDTKYIGSVASGIIKNSNLNVLFVA